MPAGIANQEKKTRIGVFKIHPFFRRGTIPTPRAARIPGIANNPLDTLR
jgi:hypothetical protein